MNDIEYLLVLDQWYQADAEAAELAQQVEKLKVALRIMGINPDSILEE